MCNGCREVKKCTLTKTIYDALEAQRKASAKISESRSGILSTEGEIARLNEILVPLAKQGQSLHQIYLNNKDELICSEKTLYNYVDGCLFDIRNIDLPRKVKYRPRLLTYLAIMFRDLSEMRDSGLMNIWNTHEMNLVDIRKDGAALRCGAAPFFL